MKIVFLGNNEFSVAVMQKLLDSHHQILCAFGNLDKNSGRGQKVVFGPLKSFCIKNNIDFYGCKNISKDGFETLQKYKPDVLVTASFGQIIKENVLDFALHGVVNVHTSLLPKYRGSCPANWVIINGEKKTGVTIMKTAKGLDTGDIYVQQETEVLPDETAGELLMRLSKIGAELLIKILDDIEQDKASLTPQREEDSSYYPMLNKEMSKIDFNKTAEQIVNFCNGLNPWPIACVESGELFLKVYKSRVQANKWNLDLSTFKNGEIVMSKAKSGIVVKCKDGLVLLDVIQAPNGKVMPSSSYLNGKQVPTGIILNEVKNE